MSLITTLAMVFQLALQQPPVRDANEPAKLAQFLVDGSRANREAFRQFTCRFTVTKGAAVSREAALAGRLLEPVVAECSWTVDGAKERYSLVVDPKLFQQAFTKAATTAENHPAAPKTMTFSTVFGSEEYLEGNDLRISFSPEMKAANLMTAGDVRNTERMTPFNYNLMGKDESYHPGRLLRDAQAGLLKYSMTKVRDHKGRELDALFIESPTGQTDTFGFDPDAGFLPTVLLRTYPTKTKMSSETFVTEAVECPYGWYPRQVVSMVRQDKVPDKPTFHVTKFDVQDMDCRQPAASVFTLRMPKGSFITGSPDQRSYLKLANDEEIHLEHLPELSERSAQALAARLENLGFTEQVILNAPTKSRTIYLWAAGAAVLLVTVAAARQWGRFRRQNKVVA